MHALWVQRKAKRRRKVPRRQVFTDAELASAAELVMSEQVGIRVLHEEDLGVSVDADMFGKAWEESNNAIVFAPSRQQYIEQGELSPAELVEARKHELERLQGLMAKMVRVVCGTCLAAAWASC